MVTDGANDISWSYLRRSPQRWGVWGLERVLTIDTTRARTHIPNWNNKIIERICLCLWFLVVRQRFLIKINCTQFGGTSKLHVNHLNNNNNKMDPSILHSPKYRKFTHSIYDHIQVEQNHFFPVALHTVYQNGREWLPYLSFFDMWCLWWSRCRIGWDLHKGDRRQKNRDTEPTAVIYFCPIWYIKLNVNARKFGW